MSAAIGVKTVKPPTSQRNALNNLDRAPMSWLPSPENADWWYILSWKGVIVFGGVAAFATAATVMFSVIQFWSGGIREENSEKMAMEARLKIAELQAVAPRIILPSRQNEMRAVLSAFSGLNVEVGTTNPLQNTSDVTSLGGQIAGILTLSGWQARGPVTWGTSLFPPSGVTVNAAEGNAKAAAAAEILVRELEKISIKASVRIGMAMDLGDGVSIRPSGNGEVVVLIGTKD